MYVEGLFWPCDANFTRRDADVTETMSYNNKFDCSETNGYNIPQDALNEV